MATVKKARLFLRRGTDTDRKTTTLCEGELGYSTDAFRVYVGDGTTAGGRPVGLSAFVSYSDFDHSYHTNLVEASASGKGLAQRGDFAIFRNEKGVNYQFGSYTPTPSSAVVLMLTGTDAGTASSWVAVNSGIPWRNLDVRDADITANKIFGFTGLAAQFNSVSGVMGGNIAVSGSMYIQSLTANTTTVGSLSVASTGNNTIRPLAITETGGLTVAAAATESNLAAGTGATGLPVAMVAFTQDGTIKYKYNTASIATSGNNSDIHFATLNNMFSQVTSGAQPDYLSNTYGPNGDGGVYEITFPAGVLGDSDKTVIINAYNYRGKYHVNNKQTDEALPILDYKFNSATKLYIVVGTATYDNPNKNSKGDLEAVYPSAGQRNSATRFVVQIF